MVSAMAMMPITRPSLATRIEVLPCSSSGLSFSSQPVSAIPLSSISFRVPMSIGDPSTVARMPAPVTASKALGSARVNLRSRAASTTARASGCSLLCSAEAASRSISSESPSRTSVTAGLPLVIVPVLSKTITFSLRAVSRAAASLMSTPISAPFPVPTMMAMGVAKPMAIIVGTGKGAEMGVLIKDAAALETARKLKVIVFDKTGTITRGKPAVTDVLDGDSDEILRLAASAEQRSEHPLARAVVDAARERKLTLADPSAFEAVTGAGIRATVEGSPILIGTRKLMLESGIADTGWDEKLKPLEEQGKTSILVARDGRGIGIIAIADTIKETSKDAVLRLKRRGLRLGMLTGDHERVARAIAGQVGIEEFHAEVLPADKVHVIKDLQVMGLKVGMVGDGVNDAPALAQSDVGFAIGTGSDIAMEAGDVTLMRGDLRAVADAIALSAATIRNAKQNLVWAFGYNVVLIPVAAGVLYPLAGILLNPILAAAAMAFSSLSVVGNALRLKKYRPR